METNNQDRLVVPLDRTSSRWLTFCLPEDYCSRQTQERLAENR